MPNPNVGLGAANAATCEPGYYLTNGVCTECNPNNESVYCPGDGIRYDCPTTDTDYNQFGYQLVDGREAGWNRGPLATSVGGCHSYLFFLDSDNNSFLLQGAWNGENYWDANEIRYYRASPGFYLADYAMSSSYDWYRAVRRCTNAPANAHYTGSGTPDSVDGTIVDANDCPWECDAGYGRVGNRCEPLCPAAGAIHAGDYSAPLFPVRYTNPSLAIGIGGMVCYGALTPGVGMGVHIQIGAQIYYLE